MASKWDLSTLPARDQFDWYNPNGVLYSHYWQLIAPAYNERLVASKNLHLSELAAQVNFVRPIDPDRFGQLITGKNTTNFDQNAVELEKFQFITEVAGSSFIQKSSFVRQGEIVDNTKFPKWMSTNLVLPELGFAGPFFQSKIAFQAKHLAVGLWFNEWQQYAREYKYNFIGPRSTATNQSPLPYEQLEFRRIIINFTYTNNYNSNTGFTGFTKASRVREVKTQQTTIFDDITTNLPEINSYADILNEVAGYYNDVYTNNQDWTSSSSLSNFIPGARYQGVNSKRDNSDNPASDNWVFQVELVVTEVRVKPAQTKAPADGVFWTPDYYKYGYFGPRFNSATKGDFDDFGFGHTEYEIIKEQLNLDINGKDVIDIGGQVNVNGLPQVPDPADPPPGGENGSQNSINNTIGFNSLHPDLGDIDNVQPVTIFQDFDLENEQAFEYYTEP